MNAYPLQSKKRILVRVSKTGELIDAKGKEAQYLRLVMKAGRRGFTLGEAVPALGGAYPNLSGIKDRLVKKGLRIESKRVKGERYHRYWLITAVEIVVDESND